jgi:pimeloyl-ACP methyl ester carboxylesterase
MLIEKTFDAAGVSINYVEGPSHGLPLVMLHGTSLRWQSFLPNLPTFSFRYHTYALDLRGHGLSGRLPGAYRVVDFAADVVRFLRARVTEPAVLLGHSLGAQIAMQVASEAPDLTRAIVLEDPPLSILSAERFQAHPFYQRACSWQGLAGTERWTTEKMSALTAVYSQMDAAGLRARAKAFSQCDPDVITHFTSTKVNEHFDPEAICPKITCPVLLFQGNPAQGGLLEDRDAERAIALLAQCVHIHLPDMGHGLHGERPPLFFHMVSNFLESLE